MRINKTKSAIKNITFGFINKLVLLLLPFVIKTIIIYKLGVEYLGLNSLFASILNVLNFAEIGFGTAITFSMYKPIAEDDNETLCALLNLYKKIYRIVGIIVAACGLAVMPFLQYLIKDGYPADINLYILYAIYLFNNVAGYFFFAYRTSIFHAHQRNDILSIISTIINCLCYGLQIGSLFLFSNYYAYIIFTPIATILNNIIIYFVSKKKYPHIFCAGSVSPETKAEIKSKVYGLMCHKVGSVVQSSIDNIAISSFLGLTILGVYSNYLYIQSAVQSFISIIFASITAGLGNNIFKDSKENNYKLFINLHYACAILVAFCTSCLLCLYQPFMKIWNKTNSPLSFTVVILICILFFISNIRHACGTYREALGCWDKDKLRPLFITLVNLVGTLISAALGSLEGIILSTIVAYTLVSIYWETKILYKTYFTKFSTKEYFIKLLFYTLLAIVTCAITYFATLYLPSGGIWLFILKAGLTAFITIILLVLFTFYTKEFKYWLNKVFKRKNKKNVKEVKTNS